MSNGLYLASNESRSGKSLVALGMMEALASRFARPAFFRPIVRFDAQNDISLQLIRRRYDLPFDEEAMVGLNREQARGLLASDRYEELLKRVLEQFKQLQSQADFVLVEGTSFRGFAPAYESELNADFASNFNCPIMAVVSARDKQPNDIVDAVRIACEHFENAGLETTAVIVNAVSEEQSQLLDEGLRKNELQLPPVFTLPRELVLENPTLADIARALNAKLVHGTEGSLDREVGKYLVAAMQLPGFLQRLTSGSLVITPGDRSDIVVGSLLSVLSKSTPNIAGILLTGDLALPAQVMDMIAGGPEVPILSVSSDTYETARQISDVEAKITIHHSRKIATALGLFESNVDLDKVFQRLEAERQPHTTPLMFEYELVRRARESIQRIVLPEGIEPRILKAVEILQRRSVVTPILLGNPEEVHHVASAAGVVLQDVEIVDPHQSELREAFAQEYVRLRAHKGMTIQVARDRMTDVSYFGTMMVHMGLADGMVSGSIHTTAHTIRPAFEFIKTKPGVSIVSSVFFMCLADRVLVYGDCAINPNPTAEQLAAIAISSSETAAMFGVVPRVAMLSYSTGDSGHGEDVDRVRCATQLVRDTFPEMKIDGPLQYDAAVDASVAKTKMPHSEVAGQATVFIFPDLNTGNNTYKAVQRSSGAVAVGPVLQGLNRPVNDLSRGCTVPDIVNTVAITAIQAIHLQAVHAREGNTAP
jgi:phosphate acetyltransferase